MDAHRAVFLEQGGVGDVIGSGAVLFASALAAMRFRADETKEFFAYSGAVPRCRQPGCENGP